MAEAPRNDEARTKPARRGGNFLLLTVAVLGALATAFFAFSQDREFAADVLRALFGLAGGSTAGG
jgi:hypothetical protein